MNKIYLVLSLSDPHEPFILDICSTREVAEDLINIYINRFKNIGIAHPDYEIREVLLDSRYDVLWTCYADLDKYKSQIYEGQDRY